MNSIRESVKTENSREKKFFKERRENFQGVSPGVSKVEKGKNYCQRENEKKYWQVGRRKIR